MDRDDYEFLKTLPSHWEESHTNQTSVALILEKEGYLEDAKITIEYFDAPWKWEPEIKKLVNDWEIDTYSPEFFSFAIGSERETALEWMFSVLNCSYDVYKYFLDYVDDESTFVGV
jgi:hypothetical protein